jgi:hypothetical protein
VPGAYRQDGTLIVHLDLPGATADYGAGVLTLRIPISEAGAAGVARLRAARRRIGPTACPLSG